MTLARKSGFFLFYLHEQVLGAEPRRAKRHRQMTRKVNPFRHSKLIWPPPQAPPLPVLNQKQIPAATAAASPSIRGHPDRGPQPQ